MNDLKKIFLIILLNEGINSNSSNNDDTSFWEDNIWLLVLLIILIIAVIVVIVYISINLYKKFKESKNKNSNNYSVNTERSSQKYISEYDKNGHNRQKLKYKERPLKEIEEEQEL